ncbi:MAG: peptidylprolyl isomerase [Bacteroidia bacterium]
MSNATNKVFSVEYTLYKDAADGEMIESTAGKEPLTFISGIGQMIPEFEDNVVKLAIGDSFSFGIKAENAYGEHNQEAIMELAKDMFMDNGMLAPDIVAGRMINLQDQNGYVHPAKIVTIGQATVTVDMNHPLAGQNLYFKGSVLKIREATRDELDHGHVHGEGGVHH